MAETWYVYIIQSETRDKLYTGISPDPERRLLSHNSGKGAKATKSGRPWYIVYKEVLPNKSEALKREISIKSLSKVQKIDLIREGSNALAFKSIT